MKTKKDKEENANNVINNHNIIEVNLNNIIITNGNKKNKSGVVSIKGDININNYAKILEYNDD